MPDPLAGTDTYDLLGGVDPENLQRRLKVCMDRGWDWKQVVPLTDWEFDELMRVSRKDYVADTKLS